jgi:uncharacterized protein YndB with AHSA1/START domain
LVQRRGRDRPAAGRRDAPDLARSRRLPRPRRGRRAARRFAFRWLRREHNEPGEGTSTFVEFLLEPERDGTRLRVIESGFQQLAWDEADKARYAGENGEGWVHELEQLRAYVAGS